MEAPFGTCDKKSPPMSSCRLRCKAMFVNETCGCVDAYMNEASDGKSHFINSKILQQILLISSMVSCVHYVSLTTSNTFLGKFETFLSESVGILEEMFSRYYMHSDIS